MKTITHPLSWAGSTVGTPVVAPAREATAAPAEVVEVRRDGLPRSMRVVGILAFLQMALFAILFLFICARGHAAVEKPAVFTGELRASDYSPTNARDPFGAKVSVAPSSDPAATASVAVPVELKLQGIMYDAVRPAALVNDKLVELKKPIVLRTERGDVEVKALEITREIVLLDVGGQKLELRLGAANRATATK